MPSADNAAACSRAGPGCWRTSHGYFRRSHHRRDRHARAVLRAGEHLRQHRQFADDRRSSASTPAFSDLIPDDIADQAAVPAASSRTSRSTNTVQGDIQNASIATFMAINGDGFFVVQKPSNFADNNPVFDGIDLYTRRGDFQVDKNGYLVNGAGYYLMGIPVDATTGNLVGSVPQLLQFQNDFLPAQPTTQIEYRANLASSPLTAELRHRRAGLRTAQSGELLGQSDRRPAARRDDHRHRCDAARRTPSALRPARAISPAARVRRRHIRHQRHDDRNCRRPPTPTASRRRRSTCRPARPSVTASLSARQPPGADQRRRRHRQSQIGGTPARSPC